VTSKWFTKRVEDVKIENVMLYLWSVSCLDT